MNKTFKFGDNSSVSFELMDDNCLAITMQARHLGQDVKYTSSSVLLTEQEVVDFTDWLGELLITRMEKNG